MRTSLLVLVLLTAVVAGGCGGHYTLTAGDHIGPAGEYAPVVVRLQRNDFFVLDLPVKDAAMRLRVDEGLERGAYTDKLGYAGTTVPTPAQPGRYPLHVDHMDIEGDEVATEAAMYVWDAARPAVAVDLGALPQSWEDDAPVAREALHRLAERANILYLTREDVDRQQDLHDRLSAGGYPNGPILLWQRERWHIVRDGELRLPRIVVEARLVSQLPDLREMFPNLSLGIGTTPIAARAFCAAGMRSILVGPLKEECPEAMRVDSWQAVENVRLEPEG